MANADAPSALADRIGRVLLALCSIATVAAFAGGIKLITEVSDERVLTEAWRAFAYIVFAGMWAMLAVAPRAQRGVWELLLIQKTAITVFALVFFDLPDAKQTFFVDASLVVATVIALVLCRGWYGWRAAGQNRRSAV
ncbi:hypothetical protein [Umezawaea sp. Da 62-37]|uniref:hypothetical protein n=1 Tax=Umezawaea sp. Da 62-37 TaxID=3075927 RepID=UPI0028F746AF|nr:hypothetical protein [Umezawaea sp. Da 62-37]WNV88066.1 hypothetical protein RM788_07190 [Umezawaea sp. Da 62-37]